MTEEKNRFNPWRIIIFVAIALLIISILSNWYAQQVTLPRYWVLSQSFSMNEEVPTSWPLYKARA